MVDYEILFVLLLFQQSLRESGLNFNMEESYFDILIHEFRASNLNIQTRHVNLALIHAVNMLSSFSSQYSQMPTAKRCDLLLHEYHWLMRPFTGEEIAASKVVAVITQLINESKDANYKQTMQSALDKFKKKYDFKINSMSIMNETGNSQMNETGNSQFVV